MRPIMRCAAVCIMAAGTLISGAAVATADDNEPKNQPLLGQWTKDSINTPAFDDTGKPRVNLSHSQTKMLIDALQGVPHGTRVAIPGLLWFNPDAYKELYAQWNTQHPGTCATLSLAPSTSLPGATAVVMVTWYPASCKS